VQRDGARFGLRHPPAAADVNPRDQSPPTEPAEQRDGESLGVSPEQPGDTYCDEGRRRRANRPDALWSDERRDDDRRQHGRTDVREESSNPLRRTDLGTDEEYDP
jgi:hypothetical protein